MLSACWLIGAYFLAVSSHKRGRLNTSVYGIHDCTYKDIHSWGIIVVLKTTPLSSCLYYC